MKVRRRADLDQGWSQPHKPEFNCNPETLKLHPEFRGRKLFDVIITAFRRTLRILRPKLPATSNSTQATQATQALAAPVAPAPVARAPVAPVAPVTPVALVNPPALPCNRETDMLDFEEYIRRARAQRLAAAAMQAAAVGCVVVVVIVVTVVRLIGRARRERARALALRARLCERVDVLRQAACINEEYIRQVACSLPVRRPSRRHKSCLAFENFGNSPYVFEKLFWPLNNGSLTTAYSS